MNTNKNYFDGENPFISYVRGLWNVDQIPSIEGSFNNMKQEFATKELMTIQCLPLYISLYSVAGKLDSDAKKYLFPDEKTIFFSQFATGSFEENQEVAALILEWLKLDFYTSLELFYKYVGEIPFSLLTKLYNTKEKDYDHFLDEVTRVKDNLRNFPGLLEHLCLMQIEDRPRKILDDASNISVLCEDFMPTNQKKWKMLTKKILNAYRKSLPLNVIQESIAKLSNFDITSFQKKKDGNKNEKNWLDEYQEFITSLSNSFEDSRVDELRVGYDDDLTEIINNINSRIQSISDFYDEIWKEKTDSTYKKAIDELKTQKLCQLKDLGMSMPDSVEEVDFLLHQFFPNSRISSNDVLKEIAEASVIVDINKIACCLYPPKEIPVDNQKQKLYALNSNHSSNFQ